MTVFSKHIDISFDSWLYYAFKSFTYQIVKSCLIIKSYVIFYTNRRSPVYLFQKTSNI